MLDSVRLGLRPAGKFVSISDNLGGLGPNHPVWNPLHHW